MDAPFTADALVRPWRTATLVASLVAAVELIALIGLALLLLAKPLAHAVRHHAEAAAFAPAAKHVAPVAHAKKQVVAKPKLSQNAVAAMLLVGGIAILGGGVAAAVAGEREHEGGHEKESHSGEEGLAPLPGPSALVITVAN